MALWWLDLFIKKAIPVSDFISMAAPATQPPQELSAAAKKETQGSGALPCAGFSVGQPVAELAYGAFSEWAVVPAKHALAVPMLAPEIVALLTSGLTASIGVLAHAELHSAWMSCLYGVLRPMNVGPC